MNIIDTYPLILEVYEGGVFQFDRWRKYIDAVQPGIAQMLVDDMEKTIVAGIASWEKDFLPILNAVVRFDTLRETAHTSFCMATEGLEEKLLAVFGRPLDVDIVFYLGLCNAAGWVVQSKDRTVIYLGIEKILELRWCGLGDVCGLIYHELGHVYQKQYGVLERRLNSSAQAFLWQLFTEGIAMYFEQMLADNLEFYHQDKNGWKAWCKAHFEEIKRDFDTDLETMTFATQRYFGDWVSYCGRGDVGYYLGCEFVHFALTACDFDAIIRLDIGQVEALYREFIGK